MGQRLDNPSLYAKDMYKAYYEDLDAADMMYDKIFKVVSGVKGAGDKSTQLLGLGDLKKHTAEGEDIDFSSPTEGWSYYVKYYTFSDGLDLSYEAVEDTVKLGNLLKDLAKTWAESSMDKKEDYAAGVFNDGGTLSGDSVFNGSHTGQTDSSGALLFDSIPMFALSGNEYTHKGGGTYYNSVAGLSLDPDNFETIYILHTATNNRNELDRPTKAKADTLLTLPGADHLMALRILKTVTGLPGTELNDKNIYAGLAEAMSWDYLTDTGAFYFGKKQSNDLQFHVRQTPVIKFFEDRTNNGYKASIVERYGILVKGRPFTRGGGSSSA